MTINRSLVAVTLLATSITQVAFPGDDGEKLRPRILSPVEKAVGAIPAVKPARLDAGDDHDALERHLLRVERAADEQAEAREIEALLAWLRKHDVGERFMVTLGPGCPSLTGDELLVLSSWPTVKLTINGYVRPPVATSSEISFKDSRNVLRLVPLTNSVNSTANR